MKNSDYDFSSQNTNKTRSGYNNLGANMTPPSTSSTIVNVTPSVGTNTEVELTRVAPPTSESNTTTVRTIEPNQTTANETSGTLFGAFRNNARDLVSREVNVGDTLPMDETGSNYPNYRAIHDYSDLNTEMEVSNNMERRNMQPTNTMQPRSTMPPTGTPPVSTPPVSTPPVSTMPPRAPMPPASTVPPRPPMPPTSTMPPRPPMPPTGTMPPRPPMPPASTMPPTSTGAPPVTMPEFTNPRGRVTTTTPRTSSPRPRALPTAPMWSDGTQGYGNMQEPNYNQMPGYNQMPNMMTNPNFTNMMNYNRSSAPMTQTPYMQDGRGIFLPNNQMPMGFPMFPLYGFDNSEDIDKDLEYMKQLYPRACQRILAEVEDECDKLEYDGSCMFDEYPDRVCLNRIIDNIFDRIRNMDEFRETEEEMPTSPDQLETNEFDWRRFDDRRDDRRNGRRRDDFLRDLIGVILFNEMHNRRRRHRSRRRSY